MFGNSHKLIQPTGDSAGIMNPGNLSQSLRSNHYTMKPLRLILLTALMRLLLVERKQDSPKQAPVQEGRFHTEWNLGANKQKTVMPPRIKNWETKRNRSYTLLASGDPCDLLVFLLQFLLPAVRLCTHSLPKAMVATSCSDLSALLNITFLLPTHVSKMKNQLASSSP